MLEPLRAYSLFLPVQFRSGPSFHSFLPKCHIGFLDWGSRITVRQEGLIERYPYQGTQVTPELRNSHYTNFTLILCFVIAPCFSTAASG